MQNQSFETGLLSPWVGYVSYSGEVSIVSTPISDGSYAAKIFVKDTISQHCYISQSNVDLTDVNELTFMLYCNYPTISMTFFIDSDTTVITTSSTPSYVQRTIDVSGYSGTHTIKFQVNNTNGAGYKTVYVDEFKLDGIGWYLTLSGTISDEWGNTIRDADITIANGNEYTTTSDENGEYSQIVGQDTYDITVSKPRSRFHDITKSSILIASDTTKNITMLTDKMSSKRSTHGISIPGGMSLGFKRVRG